GYKGLVRSLTRPGGGKAMTGLLLLLVAALATCQVYGDIGYYDHDDASAVATCPPAPCVEVPQGWDGPRWLWSGPNDAAAPTCPYPEDGGDSPSWEGGDDPDAPPECEPCTCLPSTGSCALPSKLTAGTTACTVPGGIPIPFDAPASWDGKCDNMNPIGPGSGVASLSIEPLTVAQESCAPGVTVPKPV